MPLTIVADENMPGLELFEVFGTLIPVSGREISSQHLRQADVLLVRSVTRVNQALLNGTPVRFVGSATIGTDHVDLAWLAEAGIAFHHAPGCNAMAVAEYVLQAVLDWVVEQQRPVSGLSAGVVGYGNVGRRVAGLLTNLGLRVLAYDPPLARIGRQAGTDWASFEQILSCDIVTLHVPLTLSGDDATCHMMNQARLAELGAARLLINTCRGAVVDNQALLALAPDASPALVLDVWEREPRIPVELFERVRLGTAHIAGHSVEGKWRGTLMVREALAGWLGQSLETISPDRQSGIYEDEVTDLVGLLRLLRCRYDQPQDHVRLAQAVREDHPALAFDRLRKHYPRRHELAGLAVTGRVAPAFSRLLDALGVRLSQGSASGAPV
ncbi:MAG: 4-phosphoerythronate dehydrogenase [Alcanivoracaceae bacterium]